MIKLLIKLILIILIFSSIASSETLYVNETGWYRSGGAFNVSGVPIQTGINNAVSGDRVYIWNGSYNENVDISTAHLTVEGENSNCVFVTAALSNDYVFHLKNNYINISELNVSGSTGGQCTGIMVYSSREYCHVHDIITHSNYHGVSLYISNCNNTIENVTAYNNTRNGFYIYSSSDYNTIINCVSYDNDYRGYEISGSYNNCINNSVSYNNAYGILLASNSQHNIIYNCTIYNVSYYGIPLSGNVDNNTIIGNNISLCGSHGIWFYANSDNNIAQDNIINTTSDSGIQFSDSNNNICINDTLINEYYSLSTGSLNNTIRNMWNTIADIHVNDATSYCNVEFVNNTIFKSVLTWGSPQSYPKYYTTISNTTLWGTAVHRITKYTGTLAPTTTTLKNVSIHTWAETGYNVSVNSSNVTEICIFTVDVTNTTDYYGCYVDNVWSETVQAVTGIVSWTYTDGFSEHDLEIRWNSTYIPPIAPVITLLSQTPATLYQNSTGNLNISFGIFHDSSGLNNTTVSFLFRNYDHTLNDANHSIRPPANNKCVPWEYNGQIMRAANRNESLNFEDNDTITGGDIFSWSGLDENQTRLTIHPINATYTIVNINGTVHDLAMEQMWYLDRTSMIESTKTRLAIHKSQDVLIKFWDAEIFKGNYDFIGVGYTDTLLGTVHPTNAYPINYYKLNASYNPLAGINPLDSPYIVYMGSLNAAEWVNHIYSPNGANYIRGMINNSYVHNLMNTTEIEYLYFTSETPHNKPYYINVTNDISNTNRTFGETNVMWVGNEAPYTPHPYTPNCWFTFIYNNTSFDYKLYVADNNGAWNNSSLESNMIESGLFPPTKPSVNHFHYLGINDYDMNGNYFGNFTIGCAVSTDPDGGDVTHNLTLHYIDGTYVATINNTFTDKDIIDNGLFINISFNSTSYYSYNQKYVLKLIATDNEGISSESICSCSFSLGDENPPMALSLYLSIIFVGLVFMGITFIINIDVVIKTITSLISGIIFMLSGITMFTTDINTYHNANSYLVNTGWIGTLLVLIGIVMSLYTILIIYQIFASEPINLNYKGHG